MIVVTGTKRSGTSMWMQILGAAGHDRLGQAYSAAWEKSIGEANRRGFHESRFRNGIYYRTNPDPKTGHFVPPGPSRRHAVKVFVPGLIRSDLAYLDRVIGSVRDWRSYVRSMQRLYALEDRYFEEAGVDEETGEPMLDQIQRLRSSVPHAVVWWFDNYELVRDAVTRRYPFHITTYDRVLRDPELEVGRVIDWIGDGDRDAAIAAVEQDLRTQHPEGEEAVDDAGLSREILTVFDDYFGELDAHGKLPAALLKAMNETDAKVQAAFGVPNKERTVR